MDGGTLRAKKALFACGFVLAYILLFAGLAYCAERFFNHTSASIDVVLISLNVTMFSVFLLYRTRTRNAWIEAEADRWRRSRPSSARANKAVRWRKKLLWLPAATVLMACLFLPEIAGITSHAWHGRLLKLQRYRLKTPLTWVMSTDNCNSGWAFVAKGIGRVGIEPYFQHESPIAEMIFYTVPDSKAYGAPGDFLHGAHVLSHRSVPFGDRRLDCWDIVSQDRLSHPEPINRTRASISCASNPYDFWAHFSGDSVEAKEFYKTLETVNLTD